MFWSKVSTLLSLIVAGDASVDSWFREIQASRAWRAYLATGFHAFSPKNRAGFASIGAPTLPSAYYLAPILWRKGEEDNNSPHVKFYRFLFPFSSKFPDLNFVSYVLYIYPCWETRTRHTQWAWVTHRQASRHLRHSDVARVEIERMRADVSSNLHRVQREGNRCLAG